MNSTSSSRDRKKDQEIVEILKRLGSISAIYPPELLAARRVGFIAQVDQAGRNQIMEELPAQELLMQRLEDLSSFKVEYPPELLAARRANFLEQIERRSRVEVEEELTAKDQELIRLLGNVKSFDPEYSPRAFVARRAAYIRQMARWSHISVLEALRSSIQSLFINNRKSLVVPGMPRMYVMRASVVVAVLLLAAFVGSRLEPRQQALSPAPSHTEIAQPGPGPIPAATSTVATAEAICKPGYIPPLCLAQEFDNSKDLTFQGNGSARAAVAKDTLPGYSGIHDAAYVNDGLYGSGSSWVSNSPNSWIKIDLGRNATINTVTFGRDRLGNFNDRHPGKFVIAVAMSDNVYADGNSNNDYVEYTEVYNSEEAGFNGTVSGSETIRAAFGPIVARYVKITFANTGTAVDEVEVFLVQPPPILTIHPTKKPREDQPHTVSTPIPASTALPADTPVPIPTDPPPADTPVPIPTDPPPADTPIPVPTDPPPATDVPPASTSDGSQTFADPIQTPIPISEP